MKQLIKIRILEKVGLFPILVFLVVLTKMSGAQALNISGTIKNAAGLGLKGCRISVNNVFDSTAQDGSFQLSGTVGIIDSKPLVPAFNLVFPYLRYSIPPNGSKVYISVANARGETVLKIEKKNQKGGQYILDLQPALSKIQATNFMFLNIKAGSESFVMRLPQKLKYRPDSEARHDAKAEVGINLNKAVLAKSTALEDSLTISCQGYLITKKPLTSFSGNLGSFSLKLPNILFIIADDMNDWTTMENGFVKTPNLDKLAKSGVFFKRAHASAQECAPSRTAMLSGKYPNSSGEYWNADDFRLYPLLANIETLPQYFENRGYETVDAGKIYHQRTEKWSMSGGGGGVAVPLALSSNPWHQNSFKNRDGSDYNNGAFLFGPSEGKEEDLGDSKSAKFIGDYVSKSHTKPFFAACGILKPHAPLLAPQKYFDMYPLADIKTPDTLARDLDDVGPMARTVALNWGDSLHGVVLRYGKWKEAVQAYMAAASFADAKVGVVLDSLDRGPNRDNTIVIFVSDHGVHLGEKQHWWKMTLWNRTTHIPMIFRIPGITPSGTVSPRTVSTQDIYPTLLSLLHYPTKAGVEGRDISELLINPYKEWPYPVRTTAGFKNHSVVSEAYRYTKYLDGFEELYDENKDPQEFYNIANRTDMAAVKADLQKWLPEVDVPDAKK
jgi:arylsulfatase A-like enzyme